MTATAMPRSSRAWAAAVLASAPASPRHSPIFSKTCSAWPGSAGARWTRARRRPALQHGNHAGRGFQSKTADRDSGLGHLRALFGHRRQGRHQAEDLRDLRRRGPGAAGPGLLHAGADLPRLSGPRPDDRGRLPELRRLRTGDARPHAVGQHSPRRRGRHPHPPAGEGEAGVRGGPPGDLYIFLSLATHEFFQRDGADLHCRVPISMVRSRSAANSRSRPSTRARPR